MIFIEMDRAKSRASIIPQEDILGHPKYYEAHYYIWKRCAERFCIGSHAIHCCHKLENYMCQGGSKETE